MWTESTCFLLLHLLLQFRRVFQSCLNFVSGDLSSFYLDVAKDRMYIQDRTSHSRRSCQTVQSAVLQVRGGDVMLVLLLHGAGMHMMVTCYADSDI